MSTVEWRQAQGKFGLMYKTDRGDYIRTDYRNKVVFEYTDHE
jgi:hypothetical protein